MARGNSALKSKQPKVSAGNKERAIKTMMRVEGGESAIFDDIGMSRWAAVPPSALPVSIDLVDAGATQAWKPEGDDDAIALAFVVNTMGVVYERLLDPPPEVAGLVDPTEWTRRAVSSLKRAAGQSPRCALIEGPEVDPVCVVDYDGPTHTTGDAQVTVFYPSICKYADPRARLTAEPNMPQEWVSSVHPSQAMRYGVNRILYRVRKDMVAEALRKVNKDLAFSWSPDDIIPDLVEERDEGNKRKWVWAGPCTITRPDGSQVVIDAEEGVRTSKQLIRSRQTEYLESGSKRLTRPAEEDALALVYMDELLDYVKRNDNPYRESDKGKLTRTAAWLLFLNREDSLREVQEITEVSDVAETLERAGKLAEKRGLKLEETSIETVNKGVQRLTHSSTGIGKRYGKLQPGAIASEWNDVLPFPLHPPIIKKAQAMLNEATNWYMHAVSES